jgi:putative transposase
LDLPRSSYYYEPMQASKEDLALMRRMDELYLERPFYGSRRIVAELSTDDWPVNRKRVQRLMKVMGIEAIYPRKRTTIRSPDHRVYPYLLRGLTIDRANQVWCSDITYVPLTRGFMYLVAVMDWHSRYIVAWELSNTLDASFCVSALREALRDRRPDIFNTDQGAQFTSVEFTTILGQYQVAISMDGRGRALDNVFIERLWRSLKYEDIYLKDYATGVDLYEGLTDYFDFYNRRRKHQALRNRTPHDVYEESIGQHRQRWAYQPHLALS